MSTGLSLGLLIAGIAIIVIGLVIHVALTASIIPHFNVVIGIIGTIIAAIGAWGFTSGRQNA